VRDKYAKPNYPLLKSLPVFFIPALTQANIPLVKFSVVLLIINAFVIYYLFSRYFRKKHYLEIDALGLDEKINVLNTNNIQEKKKSIALEEKTKRYKSLKDIVEEIDQQLDPEDIGESLTKIAFSQIADNRGTTLLYLIDNHTQKPNLFKAKKEDKELVIKAKEGDIFDLWVLRRANPLFIEDIKKDFRFDLEKLESRHIRTISSLISSPLISEHNFLGILRIDNPSPGFYSQDDLRFLTAICDLAAVALENAQLYQKTKDLAIHDELTRLYTRGYFMGRLDDECKHGMRQDTTFSLLMLDIDYFKDYNDKFGHTSGDIVLRSLSSSISHSVKDYKPIISRYGGEEFCVILPSQDKERAYKIAEELRKDIAKTKIILRKQETHVTVSIGLATFAQDATDASGLIRGSDKAMYEAKNKGRNQVCCI